MLFLVFGTSSANLGWAESWGAVQIRVCVAWSFDWLACWWQLLPSTWLHAWWVDWDWPLSSLDSIPITQIVGVPFKLPVVRWLVIRIYLYARSPLLVGWPILHYACTSLFGEYTFPSVFNFGAVLHKWVVHIGIWKLRLCCNRLELRFSSAWRDPTRWWSCLKESSLVVNLVPVLSERASVL